MSRPTPSASMTACFKSNRERRKPDGLYTIAEYGRAALFTVSVDRADSCPQNYHDARNNKTRNVRNVLKNRPKFFCWFFFRLAFVIIALMTTLHLISIGMGIFGALINEIIIDNEVVLPKKTNGKINLGILSNLLIGGLAGWAANDSPMTSFLAGYAGKSFIESLISTYRGPARAQEKIDPLPEAPPSPAPVKDKIKTPREIEALIRKMAADHGVDADLAVRVAVCESSLNPRARNVNRAGSVDRGLYQINNRYHPHITDEMADDPVQAINFFCENVKAGRLWLWNASRACWDK